MSSPLGLERLRAGPAPRYDRSCHARRSAALPGRLATELVPWQWGTTAFSVNTAKYTGDINTLALLFDTPKELQGRINILPDMNEMINAALRYLNLPRCTGDADEKPNMENLKKVADLLQKAKPNWRTFDYDDIGKMTSGDVDMSMGWNGSTFRIRQQIPTVKYAYPKEG